MRPTVAFLSKSNLRSNVEIVKSYAKNSQVVAMVKANAYGHGIRSVASRIDDMVDGFGVASIDEALILRSIDIKSKIIIMEGPFCNEEIFIASENNFQIAINNLEQINWILGAKSLPNKLNIWIKIDTGMNRIGFRHDNIEEISRIFSQLKNSNFVHNEIVLMSHFACADEIDHPLTEKQIKNFNFVAKSLEDQGFKFKKSLVNSAGIVSLPEYHYDIVRTGLMLYGVSPIIGKENSDFNLKYIMQLESRILAVKIAKAGESVGYGATYICKNDMKIGIIPIGYGDGYSRTIRSGAPVLVNDRICSVVGRISMDMIMIDLTNYPDCKPNDRVVLFGNELSLNEVTKYSSCIAIDMLTGMQNRVRFEWID